MNAQTHIAGGLIAGTAAIDIMIQSENLAMSDSLLNISTCLVAAVLGSLIPDIDLHRSTAGHKAGAASILIQFFFGHRRFFHSPLLIILCYLALMHFFPHLQVYIIAFLAGMASHLILDMLNKKGIPLLYPYPKRFWIIGIKTGSALEKMLCLALYGAAALLIFASYILI